VGKVAENVGTPTLNGWLQQFYDIVQQVLAVQAAQSMRF
jgi:hypothetical protein